MSNDRSDCLASLPSHFESDLGSLLGAVAVHVMHGEHAGPTPLCNCSSRPVAVSAPDADLHKILWVAVRQPNVMHVTVVTVSCDGPLVRGPEPGRCMHPLIHILFLNIDVSIYVDDAHVAIDVRSDTPNIRKTEAVVASAK